MRKLACLSLLALGFAVQPALAQSRFMDAARENAARRAENAAVREAEHPETRPAIKEAEAQQPAGSQPAAPPAETQSAAPPQTQTPAAPAQ